jgi:hypothetical protein
MENIFSPKRRGQNGSPNHVPQGLINFLEEKGTFLNAKKL